MSYRVIKRYANTDGAPTADAVGITRRSAR
jgi:hypothetical protein